ncbi:MAG TPA: hypothetical protein K8U80_10505 [Collinsella ihuae]|uniref:Uncharacterized protein n=1 Tax=Collinsella ihumii TaxID=1720204 RepID=A0A921ITL2_9ACTN|nr:hypothetical protein [Collinsella ihumii]
MKTKPARRPMKSFGTVAILALVICSCIAFGTLWGSNRESNRDAGSDNAKVIVRQSSINLPALSLNELIAESDLIASCTAGAPSDAILIDPVSDESPKFYTDTTFQVETVFYDELSAGVESGSTVTVRSEGGEGNHTVMVVDGVPTFEEDERYLLFLFRIHDGSHYNTEGDHYYIVGVEAGAWTVSDTSFHSPYPLPEGIDSITDDELTATITRLAESQSLSSDPSRHSGLNADLADIEQAYRSGAIPEELYAKQRGLAEQEAKTFARIMSPEEQEAYERGVLDSLGGEQDYSDTASSSS